MATREEKTSLFHAGTAAIRQGDSEHGFNLISQFVAINTTEAEALEATRPELATFFNAFENVPYMGELDLTDPDPASGQSEKIKVTEEEFKIVTAALKILSIFYACLPNTPAEKDFTAKQAAQIGADEAPHTVQTIPTDKALMYALDPFTPGQRSKSAEKRMVSPAIFLMPAGKTNIIKDVINKNFTGIVDDFGGLTMEQAAKDAAGTLDLSLLRQLFTVALENKEEFVKGNGFVIIRLARLYGDLGLHSGIGQRKHKDILDNIDKICRCLAIWPDGRAEEVLHMVAFKNGILKLHSEFFLSILSQEFKFSPLLASSTGKERNKAGLETAKLIGQSLAQRGEYNRAKDGRIYYKASCQSIIERVPLLKLELESINDTSHKNRKLKSTFKRAYALLQDVEKMPDMARFENLKIREVYPTSTTLDAVLEISYTQDLKAKKK